MTEKIKINHQGEQLDKLNFLCNKLTYFKFSKPFISSFAVLISNTCSNEETCSLKKKDSVINKQRKWLNIKKTKYLTKVL